MIISLDAMGGDHAPQEIVHGAVWAARDFGLTIQLVGKPDVIAQELAKHDTTGLKLPIVPASEIIEMDDEPSKAARRKKDSSMRVATRQVSDGHSQAFVSAGNSGGVLASALFGLGRIKGIKRPALSITYPTMSPNGKALLLDVGANTVVKPEYLYQFGLMGSLYVEKVWNFKRPRVGIVSTGEEEGKGNPQVVEASEMLKNGPINFIGNVEGRDIAAGVADVIVTDGFTGNVIVKLSEGLATHLYSVIKHEIKSRPAAIAGALMARGAFKAIEQRLDYREFGGGAMLGVDGVVIVTHGSSDAYTIRNALRVAETAVRNDIIGAIRHAGTIA